MWFFERMKELKKWQHFGLSSAFFYNYTLTNCLKYNNLGVFKVSKVVWCRCFGLLNWTFMLIFWHFWATIKKLGNFFSLLVTLIPQDTDLANLWCFYRYGYRLERMEKITDPLKRIELVIIFFSNFFILFLKKDFI